MRNGAGGRPVRRTIYLPDDLNAQVDAYLADHPGMTLSSLVRNLLEARVKPRNPEAILKLKGLVKHASMGAREFDEYPFGRHER
jgi:hypothetical protein